MSALADLDARVLLTTGEGLDPAELGRLPANTRVERWWSQSDVMPHAAAVVGHGGFGTTMAALVAGLPQVVVPLFAFDQHLNAEHVAALGVGVALAGAEAVDDLPEAVTRVLTEPSYGAAAQTVAGEVAALPPVEGAVDALERVVTGT